MIERKSNPRDRMFEPLVVFYRGSVIETRPPVDIVDAYDEAMASGRALRFIERVLTPASYAAFRSTNPRLGDVTDLVAAIGAELELALTAS